MLYLLLALLSFLFLVEYGQNRNDILYITFISLIVYIFALVLLILNRKWEYTMSASACAITFVCFLLMFVGEHFARSMYKSIRYTVKENIYAVSKSFFLSTVGYMSIVAILYIRSIYSLGYQAMLLYGGGGQESVLGAYRSMAVKNGNALSALIDLLMIGSECLAYSYLFMFICDMKRKKYIIPIILYIIPISFSTARSEIIKLFIGFLVMYYILKIKPSGKTVKFIKLLIRVVILGTVVFVGLGQLTKKSSLYSSVFENVSMYIASGIPAFDEFLGEYKYTFNNFGAECLWGLNSLLRKFGIAIFSAENNYLPYTYLSYMHHQTNIYTFMRRPYYDFGLIGLLIIIFAISYIYTRVYIKLVNGKYKNKMYSTIIFSTLFYPVFWIFADFRFFDVLSITGIFKLIVYWLISKKVYIYVLAKDRDVIPEKTINKKNSKTLKFKMRANR